MSSFRSPYCSRRSLTDPVAVPTPSQQADVQVFLGLLHSELAALLPGVHYPSPTFRFDSVEIVTLIRRLPCAICAPVSWRSRIIREYHQVLRGLLLHTPATVNARSLPPVDDEAERVACWGCDHFDNRWGGVHSVLSQFWPEEDAVSPVLSSLSLL